MVTFDAIQNARTRIAGMVKQTPILESRLLNDWLGHRILFKAECLQRTGSFKIRGALNTLATLAEQDALPAKVIANSSGNHAQAVAYAANLFNIPTTIYSTESISAVKAAATKFYGAKLELYPLRTDADAAVARAAEQPDTLWIPPFNRPSIIAGQGTLMLDTIDQVGDYDAVFTPCGGGGLLSGTLLCSRAVMPSAKVFGAEPLAANDAAESLRQGRIIPLSGPPDTLADGAATPSVGEHTFPILQKLDGFYEINEGDIAYWTQWLHHLLKLHIEPTSAMTMQAVMQWLATQSTPQKVVVLLSGGNIDQLKMHKIWQQNYLDHVPSITH